MDADVPPSPAVPIAVKSTIEMTATSHETFPRGSLRLSRTPGSPTVICKPSSATFFLVPPLAFSTIAETVEVDPADGSRVLCHCHWQPESVRAERLTAVLVHGLEGSSDSRYIRGIAARAWAAGMNVVRMNMRNCGGSDALTPTLYHSGRSADVGAVVRHFTERFDLSASRWSAIPWAAIWCSSSPASGASRPPLVAVATVCPAIDLAAGADALHEPANRIYEWHFLRGIDAAHPPQGRALSRRLSNRAASAPFAPSASSTRRSSRATAAFAMPTTTTTAPPAPASSIALPFPRLFSARRTIPSSGFFPRPARASSPIPTSLSSRRATAATAPSSAAVPPTASTGPKPRSSVTFRLSLRVRSLSAAPARIGHFAATIKSVGE